MVFSKNRERALRRRPTATNRPQRLASISTALHILVLSTCRCRPAAAYVPRRPPQPPTAASAPQPLAVGGGRGGGRRHLLLGGASTAAAASSAIVCPGGHQQRGKGRASPPPTRLHSRRSDDAGLSSTEESGAPGGGDDGGVSNNPLGGKGLLLAAGLAALTAASAAAKAGLLPGLLDPSSGATLPYSDDLILRDVGATLLTLVLAAVFVKAITAAAAAEVLEPRDSRKLIHTLSAPLFVLFWPAFSGAAGARYFAAIVPVMNGLRLVMAASSGVDGDEKELAGAVSRSGDASEALGGPFIYVLVLFASIVGFWTDDLTGVVAVSTMAAGDGVADLIGRRFGKDNKWPFSPSKSVAGTAAFAVAAALTSTGLAWWLGHTGVLVLPMAFGDVAVRIATISVVCAFVELIPVGDDNWTVPLSAAVLTSALLH